MLAYLMRDIQGPDDEPSTVRILDDRRRSDDLHPPSPMRRAMITFMISFDPA